MLAADPVKVLLACGWVGILTGLSVAALVAASPESVPHDRSGVAGIAAGATAFLLGILAFFQAARSATTAAACAPRARHAGSRD